MARYSWLTNIFEKLGSAFRPAISRADAVRIAEAHCSEKGWPWEQPVVVSREPFCYHIMTNADMKGGNANIRVGLKDASIVHSAFAAR